MNPDNDRLTTGAVIGAAIEVHRHLGPGARELAYQSALSRKLRRLGIPHSCQSRLAVIYKGATLDAGYRLDVLVEERLPLELKVVASLAPIHDAQILTYMRLGAFRLGLLLNFEVAVLKDGIRRRVLSRPRTLGCPDLRSVEVTDSDVVVTELLRSAVEVYRTLGPGLLRSCYEECLCHELAIRHVPFQRRLAVPLRFEDADLDCAVEVPLVLDGRVPVICLSVVELTPLHDVTLLARLRNSGMKFGFLLNFNAAQLGKGIRRLAQSNAENLAIRD